MLFHVHTAMQTGIARSGRGAQYRKGLDRASYVTTVIVQLLLGGTSAVAAVWLIWYAAFGGAR
jgi:hypothetical protein